MAGLGIFEKAKQVAKGPAKKKDLVVEVNDEMGDHFRMLGSIKVIEEALKATKIYYEGFCKSFMREYFQKEGGRSKSIPENFKVNFSYGKGAQQSMAKASYHHHIQ